MYAHLCDLYDSHNNTVITLNRMKMLFVMETRFFCMQMGLSF